MKVEITVKMVVELPDGFHKDDIGELFVDIPLNMCRIMQPSGPPSYRTGTETVYDNDKPVAPLCYETVDAEEIKE